MTREEVLRLYQAACHGVTGPYPDSRNPNRWKLRCRNPDGSFYFHENLTAMEARELKGREQVNVMLAHCEDRPALMAAREHLPKRARVHLQGM